MTSRDLEGCLKGRRVLITRPRQDGVDPLRRLLEKAGASVEHRPTLKIAPLQGDAAQQSRLALQDAWGQQPAGIVFASANAARYLSYLLGDQELPDVTLPAFAVGPGTAAAIPHRLGALHLTPTITAATHTALGVLDSIKNYFHGDLRDKLVILPSAKQGRKELAEGLVAAGAQIARVPVYENIAIQQVHPLPNELHWITFTSPLAIEGFALSYGFPSPFVRVACIGSTTKDFADRMGFDVHAVAQPHTFIGLIEAMAAAP